MTFIGERTHSRLQPFAVRARETAQTVINTLPFGREQSPIAVGSPPIEHPVFDLGVERFGRSHTLFWNNFTEKARLLKDGDPTHQDIRTALVVGGGGMAGIGSAAMLEVLRERDLIDAFDAIVGVSAGAINTACLLSDNKAGAETYLDTFASREFMQHGLWWPGGMNVSYLDNFLRSSGGLKPQTIRDSRPNFYIGTVDEYGKTVLSNAAELTDEEMFHTVKASVNAPYASKDKSFVKGQFQSDGYLNGFPIEEVLAMGYDNVLVLSSYTVDTLLGERDYSLLERLWIRSRTFGMPRRITDATIQKPDATAGSLQPLLDNAANFSLAAPSVMHADMVTIDPTLLRRAALEGRSAMTDMIDALPQRVS